MDNLLTNFEVSPDEECVQKISNELSKFLDISSDLAVDRDSNIIEDFLFRLAKFVDKKCDIFSLNSNFIIVMARLLIMCAKESSLVQGPLCYSRSLFVFARLVDSSLSLKRIQESLDGSLLSDLMRTLGERSLMDNDISTQETSLSILCRIYYSFKKRKDLRIPNLCNSLPSQIMKILKEENILSFLTNSRPFLNDINKSNANIITYSTQNIDLLKENGERKILVGNWIDFGTRLISIDVEGYERICISYEEITEECIKSSKVEFVARTHDVYQNSKWILNLASRKEAEECLHHLKRLVNTNKQIAKQRKYGTVTTKSLSDRPIQLIHDNGSAKVPEVADNISDISNISRDMILKGKTRFATKISKIPDLQNMYKKPALRKERSMEIDQNKLKLSSYNQKEPKPKQNKTPINMDKFKVPQDNSVYADSSEYESRINSLPTFEFDKRIEISDQEKCLPSKVQNYQALVSFVSPAKHSSNLKQKSKTNQEIIHYGEADEIEDSQSQTDSQPQGNIVYFTRQTIPVKASKHVEFNIVAGTDDSSDEDPTSLLMSNLMTMNEARTRRRKQGLFNELIVQATKQVQTFHDHWERDSMQIFLSYYGENNDTTTAHLFTEVTDFLTSLNRDLVSFLKLVDSDEEEIENLDRDIKILLDDIDKEVSTLQKNNADTRKLAKDEMKKFLIDLERLKNEKQTSSEKLTFQSTNKKFR